MTVIQISLGMIRRAYMIRNIDGNVMFSLEIISIYNLLQSKIETWMIEYMYLTPWIFILEIRITHVIFTQQNLKICFTHADTLHSSRGLRNVTHESTFASILTILTGVAIQIRFFYIIRSKMDCKFYISFIFHLVLELSLKYRLTTNLMSKQYFEKMFQTQIKNGYRRDGYGRNIF